MYADSGDICTTIEYYVKKNQQAGGLITGLPAFILQKCVNVKSMLQNSTKMYSLVGFDVSFRVL